MKKIAIVGVHSAGKSKICERIIDNILSKDYFSKEDYECCGISQRERYQDILTGHNLAFIPEQFREVVKDLDLPRDVTHFEQTEKITLATYAKQLYLENLYTAQGKNILCDRSVLDTFVYYDYFNNISLIRGIEDGIESDDLNLCFYNAFTRTQYKYSKIYLIEPSDRPIEDDGFRLTDKEQQLEIHKLFLEYFKDFENVEIINQEDAHKEEFIEKVANEFIL